MSSVSFSISSRSSSSITARVKWVPDSSKFTYRAKVSAGGHTAYASLGSSGTSYGSATVSGLSSNTSYTVSVLIQWNDGGGWRDGEASDSGSVMTYSADPYVRSASYSGGYVTISWTQSQGGGASTIHGRVFVSDGSTTIASADVSSVSSSNSTRVYTGTLKPGTYYANALSWNSAQEYDDYYSAYGTKVSFVVASYLLWSWTMASESFNASDDAQATSAQLSASYRAVTQRGKTTAFSWQVFNDLCRWVLQVLTQAGAGWSPTYAMPLATYIKSSDKTLTATKWNSLAYNAQRACSALGKTVSFTARSPGDKVYGSYFTTLVNNVNNAIKGV